MLTKSSVLRMYAFATVGTVLGFGSMALAEEKPAAPAPSAKEATCLQAPAKLADNEVADFISAPNKLLVDNPAGGLPMSNRVRELAGSSSNALDKIVGLIKTANDGQKSAIAAGLARTVQACGTVNPEYASLIQNSVAGLGDAALIAAFAQASNDIKVAAVGGDGGGTFSGGGSTSSDGTGDGTGSNAYRSAGDSGTATTSGTYSTDSGSTTVNGDSTTTNIFSEVENPA
jgi:hypothetical protein